ncbi:MAG: ABC transporter ATP-binding protein [Candidatus Dojkabacteria bacterium]|nr:MAG: ABC transporter ATP-binding protein [Candidatus Dojkabacteria bacterium]
MKLRKEKRENLPLIEIQDVTKKFKIYKERTDTVKESFMGIFRKGEAHEFYALDDVSFDVPPGEFLGIIGRNGSGKSTLLKTLVGVYQQDSGKITVRGSIIPFLELGVGFNPDLTARENIFLNGIILGMNRRFVRRKFDEIVEFAEIGEFLDTPVKNFSSGMMVRLAFAIAIQIEADIYILDEVLAVGDVAFQQKCVARLKELIAKGKTIIYVSHSMDTIKLYCDRVVWMEHGKVREIGEPEGVVGRYLEEVSNL